MAARGLIGSKGQGLEGARTYSWGVGGGRPRGRLGHEQEWGARKGTVEPGRKSTASVWKK